MVRRSAGKQKDPGSVSRLGLMVRCSAGKQNDPGSVSRLGPMVRRSAGKRNDPGLTRCFGSPFSSKNCDLWTLSGDFALHNYSSIKMAHIAANLNAEIILVVTVYRLDISSLSPSTVGTTSVNPPLKPD